MEPELAPHSQPLSIWKGAGLRKYNGRLFLGGVGLFAILVLPIEKDCNHGVSLAPLMERSWG